MPLYRHNHIQSVENHETFIITFKSFQNLVKVLKVATCNCIGVIVFMCLRINETLIKSFQTFQKLAKTIWSCNMQLYRHNHIQTFENQWNVDQKCSKVFRSYQKLQHEFGCSEHKLSKVATWIRLFRIRTIIFTLLITLKNVW